ncbi:unnamed protein product [Acanthoscelides obtectus]|uniref:Uncharacterized protein n=1 Tax=Acanthoscelides obtectus TaxID=200917 RepID=A0A9P0LIY3_ACAOB|nr:unnamed protein product [Acanthoscelides obtectus]CAK1681717.1 hypothetical protein AOBTE_LOCUS33241 [Acanthoscelides obtectus]
MTNVTSSSSKRTITSLSVQRSLPSMFQSLSCAPFIGGYGGRRKSDRKIFPTFKPERRIVVRGVTLVYSCAVTRPTTPARWPILRSTGGGRGRSLPLGLIRTPSTCTDRSASIIIGGSGQ